MVDRSRLIFYSNDPLDKIVHTEEGSITVAANSIDSKTINHNYGDKTYPFLQWTIDNDEYLIGGVAKLYVAGTGGDTIYDMKVVNYTNTCEITAENPESSSTTFFYKLHLIHPESS